MPKEISANKVELNINSKLLNAVVQISIQKKIKTVARETAKQLIIISNADHCIISKWNQFENKIHHWGSFSKNNESLINPSFLPYSLADYPKLSGILSENKIVQFHIEDDEISNEDKLLLLGFNATHLLLIPLFAQNNPIGLIEIINKDKKDKYTKKEIQNFQIIANHAGSTLESVMVFRQARQRTAQLEEIRKASLSLTSSLAIEDVFKSILKNSLAFSKDAMDSHIFLYENGKVTFQAAQWANSNETKQWAVPRKKGLTYAVAESGKVIPISDISKNKKYYGDTSWKGAIVGLPLKIGDKVIGVMNIAFQKPQPFHEEQLRVLGLLSDQAAIAIENARLHDLVTQQSRTDILTHLPNRRAFNNQLENEIKRSKRYRHPFVLIALDLNGFKNVNDSLGHPVGDIALHLFGQCLKANIRETDFVARIGGDEFALIFPETKLEQAKKALSHIKKDLEVFPYPWHKTHPHIEIDFAEGMARFPEDGTTAEKLILVADERCYSNKPDSDRYPYAN